MNERPTSVFSSRPLCVCKVEVEDVNQKLSQRYHWCFKQVWQLLCIQVLSFLGSSVVTVSEPISFSPIQVKLVCDHQTIQPGKPFLVGIHQTIQDGFHTYWKNAGTVGLASAIKWSLPEGFAAGPLQWPTPEISQMADYRVWGYHGEALLVTEITPSSELSLHTEFTLTGEASWMCCGKQCHPGFDTLSLTLTSDEEARPDPDWHPRFSQVMKEQAKHFDSWVIRAERHGQSYRLTVTPHNLSALSRFRDVTFYGFERQISSAKPQEIAITDDSLVITMQHEEFSGEDRDRLTGILVSQTPWHDDFPLSPLLVDVPLTTLDPGTP